MITLALLMAAAAASDAAGRDYCPERPGIDTPACIIDKGRVSIETSLVDWTLDQQPDARTDTVLIGQTLARVGVADTIEARVGWTSYGHQRVRDRMTGMVTSASRVGDVTLGAKASLLNPAGDELSAAVLPFVSLPVGRAPIGAGTWSAGVLLPVTYQLGDKAQLEATPEVDAAPDQSSDGRHLAYSIAGGVGYKLSSALTLTGEAQARRDDDPAGSTTQAVAALSLAWAAGKDLQFDIFAAAGLDREAPDHEIYAGVARRF